MKRVLSRLFHADFEKLSQWARFTFDISYLALQLYGLLWVACWNETNTRTNAWTIDTSGTLTTQRYICALCGIVAAPVIKTLVELATSAWRRDKKKHFSLLRLYKTKRLERQKFVVNVPEEADPSGGDLPVIKTVEGTLFSIGGYVVTLSDVKTFRLRFRTIYSVVTDHLHIEFIQNRGNTWELLFLLN